MKKIKNILILSVLSIAMGSVYAATAPQKIKADKEVVDYPGLNYPQPQMQTQNQPSMGLNQLLSENITAQGAAAAKGDISELRRQAIVEIAYALGSSGGLSERMKQIKIDIDRRASELDRIFDFSKMTIDNGVLAPVLTEGLSNYAQNSTEQVRIADKIYKIESPAKFVSVYPTWRSYLRFSYPSYDMPSGAYLPKDAAEKAVWDQAVNQGWQKGVRQANQIFESSFNRLERDYKGMVKYKILLAEGLITPTLIAKQNLGVTGGGKEMAINDQIFRITDHSALNPNQKDWKVEYPVTNNTNGELK
jgi:defect-in-organelle-trafficking protein DotC